MGIEPSKQGEYRTATFIGSCVSLTAWFGATTDARGGFWLALAFVTTPLTVLSAILWLTSRSRGSRPDPRA